jgi:hypothetical protein
LNHSKKHHEVKDFHDTHNFTNCENPHLSTLETIKHVQTKLRILGQHQHFLLKSSKKISINLVTDTKKQQKRKVNNSSQELDFLSKTNARNPLSCHLTA